MTDASDLPAGGADDAGANPAPAERAPATVLAKGHLHPAILLLRLWDAMRQAVFPIVFGIVLRWGWTVARRAPDRFSSLLAGGMTATIFFYVAINLLMVMGLAPVVGIPLPFMSHGGSSMMTNMICVGTLMMVDRWSRRQAGGGGLS